MTGALKKMNELDRNISLGEATSARLFKEGLSRGFIF